MVHPLTGYRHLSIVWKIHLKRLARFEPILLLRQIVDGGERVASGTNYLRIELRAKSELNPITFFLEQLPLVRNNAFIQRGNGTTDVILLICTRQGTWRGWMSRT